MDIPRDSLFLVISLALLGCSGPTDGAGDGAPVPGPSPEGWSSAFDEQGVQLFCDDSPAELRAAGVPSVAVEGVELFVGYEQVGDNQNPLLARFDDGEQVYCLSHESDPPDGRSLGITWNGGEYAYVVDTIVGGGSALEYRGGWIPAYAPGVISGGGPKVSFVGRISVRDGALDGGTFVIAVKSDNGINSHKPRSAPRVLDSGDVVFEGQSAHKPIGPDGESSMACTDYPFSTRYVFSPGLDELECAQSTNCDSPQPCP